MIHFRKCFTCGSIDDAHEDNISPHVNCNLCGSQDTLAIKPRPQTESFASVHSIVSLASGLPTSHITVLISELRKMQRSRQSQNLVQITQPPSLPGQKHLFQLSSDEIPRESAK